MLWIACSDEDQPVHRTGSGYVDGGGFGVGGERAPDGGSTTSSFALDYCELTAKPCCATFEDRYDVAECASGIRRDVIDDGLVYDPVAGEECLAALRSAQTEPSFCYDLGGDLAQSICARVHRPAAPPTKQAGDECKRTSECATEPNAAARCGIRSVKRVCLLDVPAKEGEACAGDKLAADGATDVSAPRATVCRESDGLYCSGEADKRVCKKRSLDGGPCSSENGCVTNARCNLETSTCVRQSRVGEPCRDCIRGTYCDATKVCAPAIADGLRCTRDGECGVSGHCEGVCRGPLDAAFFRCVH